MLPFCGCVFLWRWCCRCWRQRALRRAASWRPARLCCRRRSQCTAPTFTTRTSTTPTASKTSSAEAAALRCPGRAGLSCRPSPPPSPHSASPLPRRCTHYARSVSTLLYLLSCAAHNNALLLLPFLYPLFAPYRCQVIPQVHRLTQRFSEQNHMTALLHCICYTDNTDTEYLRAFCPSMLCSLHSMLFPLSCARRAATAYYLEYSIYCNVVQCTERDPLGSSRRDLCLLWRRWCS